MSTEELTATEAAELMAEMSENEPEHCKMRGLGIGVHRDGIRANGYETNRWQKYGKDRLYFHDRDDQGHDGYIDLKTGAVEGSTPICNVTVEKIGEEIWTYYYARVVDIDYESEELVAAIKR